MRQRATGWWQRSDYNPAGERLAYVPRIHNAVDYRQGTGRGKKGGLSVRKQRTRLYNIWMLMKQRCYNPNRPDFKWYGAKGIYVCDEWQSFFPFQKWAHENGYTDERTIDRVDNSGPYMPANCRWVPFSQQGGNTSQCRMLTINGETKNLKAWCMEYGISYNMVMQRISRGMDDVSAILTPAQRRQAL